MPDKAGSDINVQTSLRAIAKLVNPILRTGDHPHLAVTVKNLGSRLNKWTYDLFTIFMWIAFGSICNNWRKNRFGLPNAPILQRFEKQGIPILAAYSSYVAPKPADWPVQACVTGYWFPKSRDDWQTPRELEIFLESGPPPVCVTFGSMIDSEIDQIIKIVKKTLKNEKLRGIFVAGWSRIGKTEAQSNDYYYMKSIPYNWLYPKVTAVVQHGGTGTLAATLKAGIPSIVIPFFADQPFWAQQVYMLGVAPKPIRRSALNEKRLSSAIRVAINGKYLRKKAYELGLSIRRENGVAVAIDIINQYLGIKD